MCGKRNDVEYERPAIRCFVSFPLREDLWTDPAIVNLELAAELNARGYMVLVDPADERDLAMWERLQRAVQPPKRKWFEA